jgi:hypothetical protein
MSEIQSIHRIALAIALSEFSPIAFSPFAISRPLEQIRSKGPSVRNQRTILPPNSRALPRVLKFEIALSPRAARPPERPAGRISSGSGLTICGDSKPTQRQTIDTPRYSSTFAPHVLLKLPPSRLCFLVGSCSSTFTLVSCFW